MPTGYTYGILEGKIKSFKEFAMLCMKQFGACVHMRDDAMDAPYRPLEVSNYHLKALKECEDELKKLKNKSDNIIIKERKDIIIEQIEYCTNRIKEVEKNKLILEEYLSKAHDYYPPTSDYVDIKQFMINQLELTIKHDADTSYYKKEITKLNKELELIIDAEKIRKEEIKDIEKDIKYHKEEYQKEVEGVNERNKWVEVFINSLKG